MQQQQQIQLKKEQYPLLLSSSPSFIPNSMETIVRIC
jgi:hypothetical protein